MLKCAILADWGNFMGLRVGFFMVGCLFLVGCAGGKYAHRQDNGQPITHFLPTHNDARFNNEMQPPESLSTDACRLLSQRPHWRTALVQTKQKWGVEPWYILAFMYQESRFNPTAMSTSQAYGYAQVKDDSWDWYELKTGNTAGSRERFDDAVDFMGFYATANVARNGVALNDVKNQYLAYHEGMGGFERQTYLAKPWLLAVADKVVQRSVIYKNQLAQCPIL